MPGMTNVAMVAMRFGYYLSYLDPVMGETMLARRTLVRTQFDHTDGTEDGFALVHTNGVDAAAHISGSSKLTIDDTYLTSKSAPRSFSSSSARV